MHTGIRRVPAERARHAKRLGHVQPGSGPAVLAENRGDPGVGTTQTTLQVPTTTSSQASPTHVTSVVNPSSSALTSSSTGLSSSSSITTPSTSSVGTSTSIQPLVVSTPTSPSLATSLVVQTSTSLATSTPTPQANVSPATHNGLSGGAIAGIIAGAAVVGAALVVFFVRKTILRRRERQEISWDGLPGLGADIHDEPKTFPDISERNASLTSVANLPQRTVPPSPFPAYGTPMYSTPVSPLAHTQPPNVPTYAAPTPPPVTYNNPTPVSAYPTYPVPSAYGPVNSPAHAIARGSVVPSVHSALPPVRALHAPMEATVKCTFVPNLPDELSITSGERVLVVEQYDDGWDLCTNARGERGMVPRECLEHVLTDHSGTDWRNAGRTSSLNDGQRY